MRYSKDQFLLPLRVNLIREERRHLVDIPDRSTADYELVKLQSRSKIHDPKITKRDKTYVLAHTTRKPYSEDFWTSNPSHPAGLSGSVHTLPRPLMRFVTHFEI
jgi:hypothetical protein